MNANYLDEIENQKNSKVGGEGNARMEQAVGLGQEEKDMSKSTSVKVVRNSGHMYDSHYILSKQEKELEQMLQFEVRVGAIYIYGSGRTIRRN